MEAGYPLHMVATAMSTSAVVDLVSRLVVSLIIDLPCADVCNIYRFGQFVFFTVPFGETGKVFPKLYFPSFILCCPYRRGLPAKTWELGNTSMVLTHLYTQK